jgi:hypothetical protein
VRGMRTRGRPRRHTSPLGAVWSAAAGQLELDFRGEFVNRHTHGGCPGWADDWEAHWGRENLDPVTLSNLADQRAAGHWCGPCICRTPEYQAQLVAAGLSLEGLGRLLPADPGQVWSWTSSDRLGELELPTGGARGVVAGERPGTLQRVSSCKYPSAPVESSSWSPFRPLQGTADAARQRSSGYACGAAVLIEKPLDLISVDLSARAAGAGLASTATAGGAG